MENERSLKTTRLSDETESSDKSNSIFVNNGSTSNDGDSNDEIVEGDAKNEFVPTIVDIRGSCADDVAETDAWSSSPPRVQLIEDKPEDSELPEISIIDVRSDTIRADSGSDRCENVTNESKNCAKENTVIVRSPVAVEVASSEICREKSTDANVTIKVEPGTDDRAIGHDDNTAEKVGGVGFASEMRIRDERGRAQNGEVEVYHIVTDDKIPSPIPIKVESLVDDENRSQSPSALLPHRNVIDDEERAAERVCRRSTGFENSWALSSGSDVEANSCNAPGDRRRYALKRTNCSYSVADYTCHLCKTTFEEHELLNEHMTLHRNNSLIEARLREKSKPKSKVYSCDTCHKRLSTWQSLQQHVMVHRDEKPYACPYCKKGFRHLSNYKAHLQKHKNEERKRRKEEKRDGDEPTTLDKSVVRGVDFGRLVGPLFMKETLLHRTNKKADTAAAAAKKISTPCRDDGSSDSYWRLYNETSRPTALASEARNRAKKDTGGRRDYDATAAAIGEDDVIPLKSFNRVENIVMNAARFIVKLDNVDANVLKRKIKTPDISIEQGVDKRRRTVSLSPSLAKYRRVKLDQIENIVIADASAGAACAENDADGVNGRDESGIGVQRSSFLETLTDNELLELLNDDKDAAAACDKFSTVSENDEKYAAAAATTDDGTPSTVNSAGGIFSKLQTTTITTTTTTTAATTSSTTSTTMSRLFSRIDANVRSTTNYDNVDRSSPKINADDESEWQTYDSFDTAFYKVVLRRLVWLCKRAAENGGKLDRKFFLGPRFWRKAIRRAECRDRKNSVCGKSKELLLTTRPPPPPPPPPPLSPATTSDARKSRSVAALSDANRPPTNDLVTLQSRAECKLKFLLNKIRSADNADDINLMGPLFWRRTLRLAGVRRGQDLKLFLNDAEADADVNSTSLTLSDIGFVENEPRSFDLRTAATDDDKTKSEVDAEKDGRVKDTRSPIFSADDIRSPREKDKLSATITEKRASPLQPPSSAVFARGENNAENIFRIPAAADDGRSTSVAFSVKFDDRYHADNISYESLTTANVNAAVAVDDNAAATLPFLTSANGKPSSSSSPPPPPPPPLFAERCRSDTIEGNVANTSFELIANDTTKEERTETVVNTPPPVANAEDEKLILNVDRKGFQLIARSLSGRNVESEETPDYDVLLSDEINSMQFVVNVQPESGYANFELIERTNSNQQLAVYPFQFEDESGSTASASASTAEPIRTRTDETTRRSSKNVTTAEETLAALTIPDVLVKSIRRNSNRVNEELSDFLNLNCAD